MRTLDELERARDAANGVSRTDYDALQAQLFERKDFITRRLRGQARGEFVRGWRPSDLSFLAEAVAYLLERSK